MLSESLVANASDNVSSHYRFINIAPELLESKGPQRAIIQDGQGYMWFASYDGLIRYDGVDFTFFAHNNNDPTSLSSSNVKALAIDSKGVLWVGTVNGLNRYNPATESFTRYLNPAPEPLGTKLNDISALAIGNDDIVWAGSFTAGLTAFNPSTEKFELFKHDPQNTNSLAADFVLSLLNEPKKGLWIGTVASEVTYLDYSTGDFTRYSLNDAEAHIISSRGSERMTKDLQGNLWVATKDGLVRLDPRTGRSRRYAVENKKDNLISSNFFDVKVDGQGNVWAASEGGGLSLYQPDTDSFVNFTNNPANPASLPSNKVWAIFRSQNDELWFSHFPHGVSMLDPYSKAFKNYTTNSGTLTLSHNEVLTVVQDENKTLWAGTEDGLTELDFETNQSNHYTFDPKNPNSIPAKAVTSLLLDSKGILWLGTWGGGACFFDRKTHQCTKIKSKIEELKDASITQMTEDANGDVWLASNNGLYHFNRATQEITQYLASAKDANSLAGNYVSAVLEDHEKNLWVGTEHGLDLFDRKANIFIHHKQADNDPNSIAGDLVRTIAEDSHGNIWVGSWSAGLSLYHRDTDKFTVYRVSDGLPNASVVGIIEDTNGDLWLSTNDGLSQFNPQKGTFSNYGKEHGLAGTAFKRSAILRSGTGELFIGGTHGLTAFTPGNIYKNTAVPKMRLTNLSLFSQPVQVGKPNSPLTQPIGETELLTLTSEQSVFSIDFAALNFKIPTRNKYKYRLKGFEENWQEAGYRHSATYTNIDPGDYVFQVIGSNNDGVWNTEGASIKIRILPPWWKTWWAYTLYTLVFFGILAWILLHQQYKKALVEEQNRKLIALDKLKDDFIANTSHELRTPLNGIIGLADSLLQGAAGEVSEVMGVNLKMISTSGKRLASLVNDILDFSKLKNQNIRLNVQPTDLYDISKTVLSMCTHTMKMADLKIINRIPSDGPAVLADQERLQQILYNLIGNAIKFTKEGSITLEAELKEKAIWVKITDTGIGIPAASLTKIFNSFEQLEDHRERAYSGTGLGLAVTKQLVDLHGGVIRVESEEGRGSCFSFSLPVTDQHAVSSNPIVAPNSLVSKVTDVSAETDRSDRAGIPVINTANGPEMERTNAPAILEPQNKIDAEKAAANTPPQNMPTAMETSSKIAPSDLAALNGAVDNTQFRILIVDDNPINQQVLINQLTLQKYQIAVANDGPSALDLVENQGPFDLILLDIMMPHMSGYEVCWRLRESHPMEDLPIIFLTAKNTISDLVSGFEVGANDFLTKPISIGELNSRVKTHLQLLNINRTLERIVASRTNQVTLAHNELKTLDELVGIISQEIRIDRLLNVILNQVINLFPSISYISYWKLNEASGRFELMYTDTKTKVAPNTDIKGGIDKLTLDQFFVRSEHKIADDIYLVNNIDANTLPGLPTTKSMLCMVFQQNDRTQGVLVMGATDAKDEFSGMQQVNYERLRTHVDSALSKARLVERLESKCDELEQMSLTDQLTGLQNRRFLSKYIEHDISLLQRKYASQGQDGDGGGESDLVFFLMDIDHFKQTNDTLGHAAGDKILTNIHFVLDQVFRHSDYRIRWGGEEFLIVTRFCDRNDAPIKAEQLRTAMAGFNFEIEKGIVVNKTCSIGFACYPFSAAKPEAFTWAQVINLADLALYAVKRSQRNGWLGIVESDGFSDDNLFRKVMENPERELREKHIATLSNLPVIKWP